MSNLENTKKVLDSVIDILRDGQKGMADLGSELKNPEAKRFFLEESQVRANYAAELENELHRLGVPDVHEKGTTAGTLHRIWGDLKAKLGASDHTLLVTAEQGEDAAKAKYEEALGQDLPGDVAGMLREQQAHILESHAFVRALRDGQAA